MQKNQKTISNIKTINRETFDPMEMANNTLNRIALDIANRTDTNSSTNESMMTCSRDTIVTTDPSTLTCSMDMQERCSVNGVTHYYCK